MLYTDGNHPNKLFYMLKGKVKSYKANDDGKKLVTDLYCKGDFLGYVALLKMMFTKTAPKHLKKLNWP